MRVARQIWNLTTHLGLRWVVFRVRYALRRKAGWLRRATPALRWDEVPVARMNLNARRGPETGSVGAGCEEEAAALEAGRVRLFSFQDVDLGSPPDWHRNALTGESVPADRHWSLLGDFAFGDIKAVWEASRFGWAFALARAHRRTGEPRHAQLFWGWFADWCTRNPPNLGPNWMCGQEASFRLMAVVFASEVFGVPDARKDILARFVLVTGRRVSANLDYALSQKNNHGVSECVGLLTAALVLPEASESAEWLERGQVALREQLGELVYADGAFAQHSSIYHRVLLHDLAWIVERFAGAGRLAPTWLVEASDRAHAFARRLVDSGTGEVPLLGTNDGANVLPLADARFLDFRPVLRAVEGACGWPSSLPPGPWDEAAAWMGAATSSRKKGDALAVSEERLLPGSPLGCWHAPQGGYLDWRRGGNRVFLRCPTRFRHRPAQADMLHLDAWIGGRPVATDGGSFSYNSTERFTALANAAYHNVLTVDGIEPMQKVGRFLYLPWPRGTSNATTDGAGWQVSHNGYAGIGVTWTRELRAVERGWQVVDRVCCNQPRRLRWHWRLADAAWSLATNECRSELAVVRWSGVSGEIARLVRADPRTAYGWRSVHYAAAEPAVSLILDLPEAMSAELITEFLGPGVSGNNQDKR